MVALAALNVMATGPVGAQPEARPWEELVCAPEFTWPCSEALTVMHCESRGRPDAVSADGHMGLYQLSPRFHAHRANGGSLLDPAVNVAAAHSLYVDSGRSWRAWSCRP